MAQIAEDVRIKVLTKLPQIEDVLVHVDPEDDEVTEDRHPATSGSLSQCRPPSLVEADVKRVRGADALHLRHCRRLLAYQG